MDRRKKINVNKYESTTDAELRCVADEYGGRVCPKVRIADALNINNSGLSDSEFSYALKAHFDFVIVDGNEGVAFAVEFDGPHHQSGSSAQRRDQLKNAICRRLKMPLLRFDDQHLEPVGFESPCPGKRSLLAGEFSSVIAWVAECWFLEQAFATAKARGDIRPDEPFIATSFLGKDPTIHARAFLVEMSRKDVIARDIYEIDRYQEGDAWMALAVQRIDADQYIAGFARCLSLNFSAMSAWELCSELAVLTVAKKLRRYLYGQFAPYSLQEVDEWKQQLSKKSVA